MKVCPTPGKIPYATRQAAVWFARADGLRAYRCQCGQFHLSSAPKPGTRIGRARRNA